MLFPSFSQGAPVWCLGTQGPLWVKLTRQCRGDGLVLLLAVSYCSGPVVLGAPWAVLGCSEPRRTGKELSQVVLFTFASFFADRVQSVSSSC